MTRDEIIERFLRINVWKRGDQRAPHKPLLILFALGQWVRYRKRRIAFEEAEPALRGLLAEFGPQRKAHHPEYPFWRLRNDGIWQLDNVEGIETRRSNNDAKKSELLRLGATGGFPTELYAQFERDPILVDDIAGQILDAHFPETMHPDILQEVGLQHRYTRTQKPLRIRDPQFRYQVLVAYEHRCAVCGFDVRLGDTLIGIEAAHIKWHQAGGPDTPDNGLALCSLHHKLLDRGAYTLSVEQRVQVSEHVHGAEGLEDWLLRYHGKPMRPPVSRNYDPREEYIEWHHREVFREPARFV
jgi:putative restriction endonuclease